LTALATIAADTQVALALAPNMPYDAWLDTGRKLATSKRNIDWLIGDWIAYGKEKFPEQIALALPAIEDAVGNQPAIKRLEKTVQAFPPHLRDPSLSFDHHAHVADLPRDDGLALLKRAHDTRMPAKRLKVEATIRKIEIERQTVWRDEDIDYTELLSIVRAWNSAQKHIREQFVEMADGAKLGIIEA